MALLVTKWVGLVQKLIKTTLETDMADIKTDKHALAEQIGSFVESHGVEEAGKLLSRFLLCLAHSAEATEIEFTDHVGRVLIKPASVPEAAKH